MSSSSHLPEAVLRETVIVKGLKAAAETFPDAVAQASKDASGEYALKKTFAEFWKDITDFGAGLISLGLEEGSGVAIHSENRAEWNVADLAAQANGGACCGLYVNDSPEDIEYKLDDTKAQILVVDSSEALEKILAIDASKIPSVKKIVVMDDVPGAKDPRLIPFEEVLSLKGGEKTLAERLERTTENNVIKLIYTSGTSGRPKGVMLTNRNMMHNVKDSSCIIEIEKGDSLISFLPNAHVFQAFLDYLLLFCGASLWYSFRKTLVADLPKVRPTHFAGVPKVYKLLLMGINAKMEEMSGGKMSLFSAEFNGEAMAPIIKHGAGLDRVRFFISGAAKLDVTVQKTLHEKCGIEIREGYGLSETSPVIAVNGKTDNRFGTVGKPIPNVRVRILDEDDKDLPPGRKGQVVVSGANVFSGYLNKPEHSAKVLKNGEFWTGDRGMIDADGHLHVYGRMGHMVKFANGEYYDLEHIGDMMLRHTRLIQQIAAAGEGRDYPVAIVTLGDDLAVVQAFANKVGIPFSDPRVLIYHDKVIEAVKSEYKAAVPLLGKENPLEVIRKVIYLRPFSPENGETTPSAKIRLRHILDKYEKEIADLYDGEEAFKVLTAAV